MKPTPGIRSGIGVAREPVAPAKEEPEPKEEVQGEVDAEGRTSWSDKPTLADQFASHPGTTRKGPLVTHVFDLSDPGELAGFNTLMEGIDPRGAPSIVLQAEEYQAHEGKWSALVQVRKLEYMKLIRKGTG